MLGAKKLFETTQTLCDIKIPDVRKYVYFYIV